MNDVKLNNENESANVLKPIVSQRLNNFIRNKFILQKSIVNHASNLNTRKENLYGLQSYNSNFMDMVSGN